MPFHLRKRVLREAKDMARNNDNFPIRLTPRTLQGSTPLYQKKKMKPTSGKERSWIEKLADLLEVHLKLLNYALQRGYSYTRWQQVANTIIFKEPGNIRIHRTRVIHLYEADYNLAMGLKWRSALFQAEKKQLLNDGQYGSRPNRIAYDPVFIEELQLEISRLTRKTLIQTNYDATACYDRIVPNLGMVASQAFGVPAQVTSTNAQTLLHAQYRIRTEMGLSDESYSHCQDYPIYGTGQGSGNSPAIWFFCRASFMIVMIKRLFELNKSESSEIGMVGFVNDSNGQTNLFMTDEKEGTRHAVLLQMKANAQIWSNLLSTTGGGAGIEQVLIPRHGMAIHGTRFAGPYR